MKENRNENVGINKKNDYVYVKNAPSKVWNNCETTSHLTQACNRETSTMKNVTE